jgi:DNA-binding NarL/FixJ family response regulator
MTNKLLPRLLIGDDHALVAEAIQQLLMPDFDVVAVVNDGRKLIEAAERLHPDVILVDVGMPKLNGLDAAQRIRRTMPDVPIIYLTMNADPMVEQEAIAGGAAAFLPKTIAPEILRKTIHDALSRRKDPHREHAAPQADARFTLTDRQRDVLQLLAEGLSMKQVGDVLNLATRTVAFHKYRIMDLLGLHNDSELFQFAIRHRLIFLDGTRGAPDRTIAEMTDQRSNSNSEEAA